MLYPQFLKNNGCIGIPAPSAGANTIQRINRTKNAIENLNNLGYKLMVSNNLFNSEKGRSAPAKIRAEEVNNMFKNNEIDLILCAAGGEFLVEMLPFVDFELLKNHPKFVAGFSDPTGLLYPITTLCDIATIYGQNFGSFGKEKISKYESDFIDVITGKVMEVESYELYEEEPVEQTTGLELDNLTHEVYWKTLDEKPVEIQGRIIGGCLDVISELAGTKYDGINKFNEKYKKDGIIWYFDNCELSMEETIRTLWKLNELEYFKYTKGVIFGRFGEEKSFYEYDVKTCLKDSILGNLNIPIVFNADISHKAPCLPIINGSIAVINVKNGKGKIKYKLI